MKVLVIGHGMVGHKFLESLADSGASGLEVTVLCEEPRPAYDRVHLSEFFSGKNAEQLSLVRQGFFENSGYVLKLNARATAIDLAARKVTASTGEVLGYDKLVPPAPSPSFRPWRARTARTASSTAPSRTWKRCWNAADARAAAS
jgi:nitrite reductase (NADH) large subunit